MNYINSGKSDWEIVYRRVTAVDYLGPDCESDLTLVYFPNWLNDCPYRYSGSWILALKMNCHFFCNLLFL